MPPEPEPQAVPVLEIVPSTAKVAQPGVPPALETRRFVVEAIVVESVVEVAAVVEPIADSYPPEGKMTWLGSESVHVLSALKSCAPAEEVI